MLPFSTITNPSRVLSFSMSVYISLGQIVGAGFLDASTVEHVLTDGAMATGLGEREALLTIRSGLRAGLHYPREPQSRTTASPSAARREATADVGLDIAP